MTDFLTTSNQFWVFCETFVVCDTVNSGCLICLPCTSGSGPSAETCKFGVASPCGSLNLNVAGMGDTTCCNQCDEQLNGDYELPQIFSCQLWGDIFNGVRVDDPGNPFGTVTVPHANLELGTCCSGGDIVLYAYLDASFGGQINIYKELDRQPFIDGKCYFFDWTDPDEELTCTTDEIDCVPYPNDCETEGEGAVCDVTSATFTITPL